MTDDLSDKFAKVLEGEASEEPEPASQVGEGTSVTPPSSSTIKLGDREYSTEELEKRLKFAQEVEEFGKTHNIDYQQLMPEFTKRSTKLKDLEKKVEPIEQAFDKSREPKEELPEDYDIIHQNAKRYHLVREEDVQPLQERLTALESKLTEKEKEELRADLESEVKGLTSKYDFVKWSELQPFMIAKANAGANLSPEDAARLLYPDQFALIRVKELGVVNPTLPQVDANGRGSGGEVPPAAKLDFDSGTGKISDALEESLNTEPVQ